jgi:peptide chain release factor 2
MKILQAKLSRLQELKNAEEIAMLKGEVKEGSWGNQIRSYVLHPYQLVKDHRTDAETSSTADVLDGDLKLFIEAYLTHTNQSAT